MIFNLASNRRALINYQETNEDGYLHILINLKDRKYSRVGTSPSYAWFSMYNEKCAMKSVHVRIPLSLHGLLRIVE